jgi:2-C-methyl-D-erythritol 2,4-cyclodiphosphate synthase
MDAILGAIGGRDIGTLFPDTDAAFKDADSIVLLEKVWAIAHQEGWRLVNADISVLAEAPKLKPHVNSMLERLSGALRCSPTQLAVKATTTEKLGFVGREEGIVATAVVLLTR